MGRQGRLLLVTLAVVALLSAPLSAADGEYSIRGLVQATVRLKQLPRVRLLTGTSRLIKEVWADTAGRFSFVEIGPGRYWVEVSAPGFRTVRKEVPVYTPSSPEVIVELESESSGRPQPPGAFLDARVPPPAWQQWERAEQALKDGKPGNARKCLDKAVKEYGEFAAAWRLLAQLDLDENKLDDAEHHVRTARAIEPENADGYVIDGELCNARGQSEQALKLLERAVELQPTWRGQFELAKSRFALKAFEQARGAAQKAIELRTGEFPEAHVLMGNILVNLRKYPEAAREYQTFLKLAPDSTSAGPAREVLARMKAAGVPIDE